MTKKKEDKPLTMTEILVETTDVTALSEMKWVDEGKKSITAIYDHPELGKMPVLLSDSENVQLSSILFKMVMDDKKIQEDIAAVDNKVD